MAMTSEYWSITGLATELKRDRRTISAALSETPPDGKTKTGHKGWLMKTAIAALGGGTAGDGVTLDKNAELTRKAKEEADKLQMENALRRGELREAADVDAAMIAANTRVRAKLLAIPAKLAPKVITANDANEAETMLSEAIREVLRELSETNVAQLEANDGDMVEGVHAPA